MGKEKRNWAEGRNGGNNKKRYATTAQIRTRRKPDSKSERENRGKKKREKKENEPWVNSDSACRKDRAGRTKKSPKT